MSASLSTPVAARGNTMAMWHRSEWLRTQCAGAAFDYLNSAGAYEGLARKLERLLRRHRQHVFDTGQDADLHHRAILRLKRTTTARAVGWQRHFNNMIRVGHRLEGMGY